MNNYVRNFVTSIAATMIALAVFTVSAWANQAAELDIKVPFAFKAGDATLPAGTYQVTQAGAGYILIRGEKGGAFVPARSMSRDRYDAGKTSVTFRHTGDLYVLQGVRAEK